jgi:acyl-CoA reductase-like NAD-dependent aldehyde dehydrogenase
MFNQGEICTTPSRILVHEDIADFYRKNARTLKTN